MHILFNRVIFAQWRVSRVLHKIPDLAQQHLLASIHITKHPPPLTGRSTPILACSGYGRTAGKTK